VGITVVRLIKIIPEGPTNAVMPSHPEQICCFLPAARQAKVKFELLNAFHICIEMAGTPKKNSAPQAARRYKIRPRTARIFMHRVR